MLRLNAMNTSALCLWSAVGDLAVPKLATQECAALIMLAATLLVFRTFRERYLLIWILGWLAYFVSPWTLRSAPRFATPAYLVASSEGLFVMAVCLFAAAVFVYSHARRLIAPLVVISMAAIAYAVVRAIYWPDSVTLRVALEITYRFEVAADARFSEDYRVFAHVVDTDGEQMWTDDHDPPTPTSQWKPGQVIEYTRTVFVPIFPYVGEATNQLGLHSPKNKNEPRLPLNGESSG